MLYTKAISLFGTKKYKKIQKISENGYYVKIVKMLIFSERLEEFQCNFQERCGL